MKNKLPLLFFIISTVSIIAQDVEWREMVVGPSESVWASSALSEKIGGKSVTYGPQDLFDGDRTSPWVEGAKGSGIGESVTVLTNRVISELTLVNGFARSQALFSRNNRVKRISLVFVAGMTAPGMVTELDYSLYFVQERAAPREYELKDSMESQSLNLHSLEELQKSLYLEVLRSFSLEYPDLFAKILDDLDVRGAWDEPRNVELIREAYGFFALKIVLEDVYKGSRYDDSCISELALTLEEF